jgi:hypothetical protein
MTKTFQEFRTRFLELITSPALGEPPRFDPAKRSAASKELSRTKLLDQLRSTDFCEKMYALSQTCWGLEAERKKALQVSRRMRPAIHRYRSGTRRLESCARKLAEFDEMYRGFIDQTLSQKIRSAVALIEIVAGELDRRRGVLVSNLHPKHRRDKDESSEWELLFKLYDYDLEKVGVKATDLWFWKSVNDAILEFIKGHKAANLSAMTRFKLIAAISEAADHGRVPPTTIKQFLVTHPGKQGKPL